MFQKAILHFDLDAFFVSVEVLKNTALSGKPLIVGGTGDRGVVSSCSYEARRYGVRSAMPVKMALKLCPDAIVLRGDYDEYSRQSKLVTDIISETAPLFEKASIDEFYLDLSGMDKYVGCWKWSGELRAKIIRETGLPISMGLSVNKLVSKVGAGEAKPNGAKLVENNTEKIFLSPLSIAKIPSVGRETFQKLSIMGVRKVGTLAQIPPKLLEREFGKHGVSLWKKANGIDNSPIVPYHDRQSISAERTFQTDTIDVRFLESQLTDMTTRLAFDLRSQKKLASCVSVKIRYSDFNTYSRQHGIPYTAHDGALLAKAKWLFEKLYQRRQLVRLIGVKFSGLTHGHCQMNLFENTPEEVSLLKEMDHIRHRFGERAVMKASAL